MDEEIKQRSEKLHYSPTTVEGIKQLHYSPDLRERIKNIHFP